MRIRLTCEKCGRESEVEPTESGMVNLQRGMTKFFRLACPYCQRAIWRKEETLRAEGKIISDRGGNRTVSE